MDAEERDVYHYLKSWGRQFVSRREIARRAGGKHKFRQSPNWCEPVIERMVEQGILESGEGGHYRIKALAKQDEKKLRFISPQMAKILKDSGKDFSETIVIEEEDLDGFYESL
jgi:hypothetical protein